MNEEKQLMKAKLQQERREKKALEVKREKIHQKMVKDDFINRKKEKVAPSEYCISLQHINKIYPNHVQAVFDFNLDIKEKEFIVLVGPSGCGKSTTLRMVAGLEDITYGDFYITGRYGNDLLPKQRDIAMVFQNYALYPNMTVYDNMAFSLRVRHIPKDEIDKKVQEAAEILGIKEYLHRKPSALSGGQRQRVALGRAIVRNAKVFLMDEPLSNLDAKLRVQMRSEIIKLHKRVGSTTLYVTHDQTEAMTMASRIVVMKDGYIQQIGVPKEIYNKPSNIFVATFIGAPAMNILDAQYNKGVIVLKNGFKYELSPDLVKKHDKFYVDMKSEYEKRICENETFIEEKRADYADLEALKDRDNYDKVRTKEESKIIDLQAAVRYFRKEKLELEEQNASQRAIDAKEQKIQEYEQKIVVAQEEMNKKLADLEAQNENRKVDRKNRDNAKLEQLRNKCSEAEYEQKVKQLEEEKLQRIEENLDKDDLVLLARLDNEKYRRIIEQVDEVIEKKVHDIKFGVRPEDVVLENKSVYLKNKSKTLQLNADLTELMGNEVYIHCNLGEQDVIAKVDAESNVEAGDKLKFVLNVEHTHIFDTISTNRVI